MARTMSNGHESGYGAQAVSQESPSRRAIRSAARRVRDPIEPLELGSVAQEPAEIVPTPAPTPTAPISPQCPHCRRKFETWPRARKHVKYCRAGKSPRLTVGERIARESKLNRRRTRSWHEK